MKATRPGTDQELELFMFADDEPLQEYILPRGATAQDTLECFVPVKHGQKLTVGGRFVGTTLSASFDLVVDGSFLAESKLTDKGARQYMSRKLTFERVYDCPRAKDGWTSKTHNPLDLYEANLYAEPLQISSVNLTELEQEDIRGARPGVGSIQIVANLQDTVTEHRRMDPEWDIEGGAWIHRYKHAVRFSGIKPDHAVEVRHISEAPIPQKRSKQHRSNWNVNPRPGFTPWARFIFYYRSSESIEQAGCMPRGTVAHQLQSSTAQQKAAKMPSGAGHCYREGMPDARSESNARSVTMSPLPKMRKFSRLGGDFSAQLRQQSEDLVARENSEPISSRPPLTSRKYASVAKDAAIGSTNNKAHSDHPRDSGIRRCERDDFSSQLTLNDRVQAQTSLENSYAGPSATPYQTPFPGPSNTSLMSSPSDMSKYAQFISKLPPLAEVVDMIGEEGITQGEAVKIFDDLASEHGFRKPPSTYSKVRAEYNARLERVADLCGGHKYILKNEYLAQIQEREDTTTATPKGERPPPAPMVAPRLYQAAPSPAVSDSAIKRKRASDTPELAAKKIKSEHHIALEARRADLARLKAQTAAILQEAEDTKARRAAKKAEKARLKEQREKEQREREQQEKMKLEQEELRMLDEELEAQQAAQDAARVALAIAEESDSGSEDDDDNEGERNAEMLMNGEGEAESEEE